MINYLSRQCSDRLISRLGGLEQLPRSPELVILQLDFSCRKISEVKLTRTANHYSATLYGNNERVVECAC